MISRVSVTESDVPVLVENYTKDGQVILYVSDDGSSVDYSSIFGLDAGNNRIEPISVTAIIGEVIFPYPETYLNVYIPDRAGNVLHLVINNSNTETDKDAAS